jgi:hypothetical protein
MMSARGRGVAGSVPIRGPPFALPRGTEHGCAFEALQGDDQARAFRLVLEGFRANQILRSAVTLSREREGTRCLLAGL